MWQGNHRRRSFVLGKSSAALAAILLALLQSLPCCAEKPSYDEGVVEFQADHFAKAAQIFEGCIAGRPNNPELYYYAAITFERLGNYKKAVDNYKYAVSHFPNTRAARFSEEAMHRDTFQKIITSKGLTTDSRDPGLDTYPRETWVNFTRHNNTVLLDGSINEHPIKMVFDTGASSCVFSVDQLEQLGIEPPSGPPNGVTVGVGSNRKMPVWNSVADLRLGKIVRKKFPIIVSPSPLAYPLLGENFFHELKYTIDNEAKAVLFKHDSLGQPIVVKPHSPMMVSSAGTYVYSVPFTIENRALIVVAKLDGRDCPMIFDTGADICMFTNEELTQFGIKPQFVGKNFNVRGASGTAPAQLCVIQKAQLGPISGQMPCLVTDQAIVPRPLLGQSFFKDWQYTIDQTNHVIQFARR